LATLILIDLTTGLQGVFAEEVTQLEQFLYHYHKVMMNGAARLSLRLVWCDSALI